MVSPANRMRKYLGVSPILVGKGKSQTDFYLGPSPTRDNPVMTFVPAAVPRIEKETRGAFLLFRR